MTLPVVAKSKADTCQCHGSKMMVHTGLPTQPAVKLPTFSHPVTAVAFAPAECNSCSAAEGSGRDLLAVGLESGALQLWGLLMNVTASSCAHIGNARTVSCSRLALILVNLQAKLCRSPKIMPVFCLTQRLFSCCRSRTFMGGAQSYGALRSHQEIVLDLL